MAGVPPPIRLTVTKSAFGGDGIASYEGKVCFVEGALIGEEVDAEILQDKKDYLRLRALRILKASPHRVVPPCPYYGRCGGCQTQHASYEEELRMKGSQFREMMEKLGGVKTDIRPIVHGEKDYHYRSSATFHVGNARKGTPSLCYVSKDNVTPIAVKSCDLLSPPLTTIFGRPPRLTNGTERVTFRTDGSQVVSDQEERFFRVKFAGETLLVSSKAFFQNNLDVTALLCKKISEWVAAAGPGVFFDLYAGVGTFSLLCAASCRRVVCVEEDPYAVSALRMNKEERKLGHLEVFEGRVEKIFPELWRKELSEDSLIFLDPPRQGMDRDLADFMAGSCRAKAMIYVSCDIATLARDLRLLAAGGHWQVREAIPFDMFPRTKHLEAAVFLRSA